MRVYPRHLDARNADQRKRRSEILEGHGEMKGFLEAIPVVKCVSKVSHKLALCSGNQLMVMK